MSWIRVSCWASVMLVNKRRTWIHHSQASVCMKWNEVECLSREATHFRRIFKEAWYSKVHNSGNRVFHELDAAWIELSSKWHLIRSPLPIFLFYRHFFLFFLFTVCNYCQPLLTKSFIFLSLFLFLLLFLPISLSLSLSLFFFVRVWVACVCLCVCVCVFLLGC